MIEEQLAIEVQHINVKLLLNNSGDLSLEAVIPVFHSWIQDQIFDEVLLDVADYQHVKDGPGVVLIGHEADYSLDNTDGRVGVRYNRKAPFSDAGSNEDRLRQAVRAAMLACQRLEADTRLDGKFHFNGHDFELFINDRLIAPNTDETQARLDPDFRQFCQKLFDGDEFSLQYQAGRRKLFGAAIHSERAVSIEDLLQNLAE